MRARQEAMDVAAVFWGEQDQPWKLIVDLGRHVRDETRTSTSEMLTRQEMTQGEMVGACGHRRPHVAEKRSPLLRRAQIVPDSRRVQMFRRVPG